MSANGQWRRGRPPPRRRRPHQRGGRVERPVDLVGVAAGFDFETGTRLVCEEIRDHEPVSLDDVRVIAYGTDDYETLERVAAGVQR